MPSQAQWHDMVWGSSTSYIRTIKTFDYSRELDIEKSEDSEDEPPSQTIRTKPDTIKLTYTVARNAGVDPRAEIEGWYMRLGVGVHAPFQMTGRHIFGMDYLITKVGVSCEVFGPDGTMLAADIDLEFTEYFEDGNGLIDTKGREVNLSPGLSDYSMAEQLSTGLGITASETARRRGLSY